MELAPRAPRVPAENQAPGDFASVLAGSLAAAEALPKLRRRAENRGIMFG